MKRKRIPLLTVAAALTVFGCKWEIPQEVVFRAHPEFYVPTGQATLELDFVGEIVDVFTATAGEWGFTVGEKDGGYNGKPLTL